MQLGVENRFLLAGVVDASCNSENKNSCNLQNKNGGAVEDHQKNCRDREEVLPLI